MPRSPVLAKLTRPRTHQAVARERLFALLDRARECPLVWIDSPPGSGKTTLVASYLQDREGREVWYQVDTGDSDPAAFFHYLSSTVEARGSPRLPQLASEHLNDLPAFARRFFRQFFTRVPLLVLDNFQEAAEPLLTELLRHAVEEVPPQRSLIVISRSAPPANFAELEVRAQLFRIDWSEVKLTLEETRAMSARRGIAEDWIVQSLHRQASGWAAGVTLMLERFKHAGSGAGQLSGETPESVFNYFASLVFDQASDTTQQTLLSLAYLPRMTAALAAAVSGNPDAGKLLEILHRRQLFTDRRAGPEPVYQFHALFREFLQTRLLRQRPAQSRAALLQLSAQALVQHDDWEPAFELLVDACAWADARSLLLERAQTLMESGRCNTLVRWAESLPEGDLEGTPWLQYWRACALAQIAPAAAIPAYSHARIQFEQRSDKLGVVLSTAGLLQVCSVDHADYGTVERVLDGLAEDVSTPGLLTEDQELSVLGALIWSAFFVVPWHPCIPSAFGRIQSLLQSPRATTASLPAAISALTVATQSAQMDLSQRLREVVRRLAACGDASPLLSSWGLFQVAHSYFVNGQYEESLETFDRIWSLAQEHDLKKPVTAALMHRFMIDFRLSDTRTAEGTMARIEMLPAPTNDYSRSLLACYRGRLAQLRGDLQAGADHARESQMYMARTSSRHHEFLYGLINAEMLMRAGRLADARPLLVRSREIVERSPILANMRASVTMVEAWAATMMGDRDSGLGLLQNALGQSKVDYGWCQLRFVDTTLAHMLPVALERDIETDQARWLIRTFRLRPPSPDIERWPWPLRIRTLGDFEVRLDERPLEVGRKTPRRVLALLKSLVALGPRDVPEQQLVDALWPDEEGDAAHKSLSITVLRLRRLLGDNDMIRQCGGKLSIDPQRCWVDAWAFERRLSASEASTMEKTLALYRGSFLPDDVDASFTVPTRERLRAKFVHALGELGRQLEAHQRYEEAIGWYLRGLEADPIIETFYQGLMRCYVALDRRTEAIAAYRRLKQTLSVTLGLAPSTTTERLHLSVRGG